MKSADLLTTRRTEREALLNRIIEQLEADPRVGAAWLFGSLGRGTSDDLSDIDLWVVVDDAHIRELSAARREYVARLDVPLLTEEAPQNAPMGGAYLLVLYSGGAGPHQVDWYWQPQSHARVPGRARVLFNRVGVPAASRPEPQSQLERTQLAAGQIAFFWAMCDIAAKKIARRQPWSAIQMLTMLGQTLDEVRWLVGEASAQPEYGYEGSDPPPVLPSAQLALLRGMAGEMEALMARVAGQGGDVPQAEAISQIYSFLDLVAAMIEEEIWPQL
jgi:predicted nucleotidyltransferase